MVLQDVERILRDVLTYYGVPVSMFQVESTGTGWRVTVTDCAHRVVTTEVVSTRPAAIRAALTQWVVQEN